MLTGKTSTSAAASVPLTHRDCLAAAHQAAQGRADGPLPWVQVRRRNKDGPYVLCGQVVELGGSGADLFKVDTCIGSGWVESRNVRLCSGDGRCTCEADSRQAQQGAGDV